ncbi:MAG: molybdopterin converting factor subunit 1 [Betaproteobacteria bacterium]|nr:molybdopterin converting factor subunit 1 [Betaproteobacteria bacterium]
MLKILYFARLREAFGASHEEIALPAGIVNVGGLVAFLHSRGGNWEKELAPQRNFRVAVNQDMADPETKISAGDEIALFPPVTGG